MTETLRNRKKSKKSTKLHEKKKGFRAFAMLAKVENVQIMAIGNKSEFLVLSS